MSGIARQFEPQITRSGGAPSKYRFTIRCSDCARTDTYEAFRPTSQTLSGPTSTSAAGYSAGPRPLTSARPASPDQADPRRRERPHRIPKQSLG